MNVFSNFILNQFQRTMEINGLFVRDQNQYLKVNYEEIIWIEDLSTQIKIYTTDQIYSVKHPFNSLIDKLPSGLFIRIHKQYIVNASYLNSIDISNDKVSLAEAELPLGINYKSDVINRLNYIEIID